MGMRRRGIYWAPPFDVALLFCFLGVYAPYGHTRMQAIWQMYARAGGRGVRGGRAAFPPIATRAMCSLASLLVIFDFCRDLPCLWFGLQWADSGFRGCQHTVVSLIASIFRFREGDPFRAFALCGNIRPRNFLLLPHSRLQMLRPATLDLPCYLILYASVTFLAAPLRRRAGPNGGKAFGLVVVDLCGAGILTTLCLQLPLVATGCCAFLSGGNEDFFYQISPAIRMNLFMLI